MLVIGITVALNALDGFDVASISFAGPGIAREWGIERGALGIVLSMEVIGMALGSLCLGGVADKSGAGARFLGQIYEGVRIRPAAGRAAYLAEACADDEALRRDVQALLDEPSSPPFLEGLTPAAVAQAIGDEARSGLSGTRFGVYLVHELIDKGDGRGVSRA